MARIPALDGKKPFEQLPFAGYVSEGASYEPGDHQFRYLENVRPEARQYKVRGGQQKFNASALSGTMVVGIFDGEIR